MKRSSLLPSSGKPENARTGWYFIAKHWPFTLTMKYRYYEDLKCLFIHFIQAFYWWESGGTRVEPEIWDLCICVCAQVFWSLTERCWIIWTDLAWWDTDEVVGPRFEDLLKPANWRATNPILTSGIGFVLFYHIPWPLEK